MAMSTTNSYEILTPDQVSETLVLPTLGLTIADLVSTTINITTHAFRVPRWKSDPSAGWVAEGEEIPLSDGVVDEVVITPTKLAGVTVISHELAEDSSYAATQLVGLGLARDIARKLDACFFGNVAAPAQHGLAWLATQTGDDGPTTVTDVSDFASLDGFAEAVSAAEALEVTVDHWVTTPAMALTLAKLRTQEGSNQALLAPAATASAQRMIEGRPLLVSPYVEEGVVWGIPRDRTFLVIRDDSTITADSSVFFISDRVAVRGVMRVGIGFVHPQAIIRLVASV